MLFSCNFLEKCLLQSTLHIYETTFFQMKIPTYYKQPNENLIIITSPPLRVTEGHAGPKPGRGIYWFLPHSSTSHYCIETSFIFLLYFVFFCTRRIAMPPFHISATHISILSNIPTALGVKL